MVISPGGVYTGVNNLAEQCMGIKTCSKVFPQNQYVKENYYLHGTHFFMRIKFKAFSSFFQGQITDFKDMFLVILSVFPLLFAFEI